MLKEAAFLGLMLIAMVSAADEPTVTTTTAESTTTTTNTTTFVPIGSNNESVVPIVHHAISAQARKIELTQLNSAVGSDVTAALKSPTGSNSSMAIGTTGIAIIVAVAAILIVTVLVGNNREGKLYEGKLGTVLYVNFYIRYGDIRDATTIQCLAIERLEAEP